MASTKRMNELRLGDRVRVNGPFDNVFVAEVIFFGYCAHDSRKISLDLRFVEGPFKGQELRNQYLPKDSQIELG